MIGRLMMIALVVLAYAFVAYVALLLAVMADLRHVGLGGSNYLEWTWRLVLSGPVLLVPVWFRMTRRRHA